MLLGRALGLWVELCVCVREALGDSEVIGFCGFVLHRVEGSRT